MPLPRLSENDLQANIRSSAQQNLFLMGYVIGYLDSAGKTPAQVHIDQAVLPFAGNDQVYTTTGRAPVKAVMAATVDD
jgi:hypothetical protein